MTERIFTEHGAEVTNSIQDTYVFRTFEDCMSTTVQTSNSKNVIRISVALLILLASGYIIIWFLLHKREVPKHAYVVPANAMAVVTLNIPELAEDYMDRELGIDSASTFFANELKWIYGKESSNNGIALQSDVLLFAYQSGEAAYFGVALEVEDSAAFGKHIRTNNQIRFQRWNDRGFPVMRIDTTPAVIGWTNNTALLIYPITNHGVAHTSVQCIELLKQKTENSIAANANYCKLAETDFDAALWIQPKPLLTFTDNGALLEQTFSGVEYVNYNFTFEEGKILGRCEWTLPGVTRIGAPAEMPLPAEGTDIIGMIRFDLNTEDSSMYDAYADAPPVNGLPLTDEEAEELLPFLSGACALCMYDTIESDKRDTSHNIQMERGYSYSYVLSNPDRAKELLTEIMERDSVPFKDNAWIYNEGAGEIRMTIDGNLLSVTNSPKADGRRHEMPLFLKRKQYWFDIKTITKSSAPIGILSWFFPSYSENHLTISEIFRQANGTTPAQLDNLLWSTFEIEFTDPKTNGLIQLEKTILRLR